MAKLDLEKIFSFLTQKNILYPMIGAVVWIIYVLSFYKNPTLKLETKYISVLALVVGVYFMILWAIYIYNSTDWQQKNYYKTLPSEFHMWFLALILFGIYKYGFTSWLIFWILIFGWIIYLINSRYYALFALWCLGATIIYLWLEKNSIAENYSIYLYYFLILSVVIGIFESKYLENPEQKK